MKEKNIPFLGAPSRLIPLFIVMASLLVLPEVQAEIGGTFTNNGLTYTVQTEETDTKTGTVSVAPESLEISGEIVIPALVLNEEINYSVTTILQRAFYGCNSLTSITIGDNVTAIGSNAFANCSSLKTITIGDGVTEVGGNAFANCKVLENVIIGDGVTSIRFNAFSECGSLASVTIPDSVTYIDHHAFYGCTNLTSVALGNGLTEIGEGAFVKCTRLPSIEIPDSVTLLGRTAFSYCTNLTNVKIGSGITEISYEAFSWCSSLANVEIPESVTTIGSYAFYGCTGLPGIVIPNSVTSIGIAAFYECSSLTSLDIPDSVTSIADRAFQACFSLTSLKIGSGITEIGFETFSLCSSLTDLVIPKSITSIGRGAFDGCSSLAYIEIPESVRVIGTASFGRCTNLKSITLPSSIAFLGDRAFQYCPNLTDVYFKGNAPELSAENSFFAPVTIYYRAGTIGWTNPWDGRPTALWKTAPDIIDQPLSQAVMEGASVTFSVIVIGTEPFSYQWYKDGVALENEVNPSYMIESVSAEHLGDYTVVVSNELGETTSTAATLTLAQPRRAAATVQVVDGAITGLTITDGGYGYSRVPNVRIRDESGTGFEGHCIVENGIVVGIVIDNPGSNYSSEATILIGSPGINSSLEIGTSELNAGVRITMHLALGMEYQLWSSVDCVDWTQEGEPFTAEEEEMDILRETEGNGRFFKLQEI
jgi:hypothetical protein